MRKINLTISSAIILSVLTISIPGCATNRVSLVDTHQVSVAKRGSEKIRILWTDVYQKDGQTWAYGVLKQRARNSSTIKTHVDIRILNSDGAVQYETTSKYLYVPRNRVGKGPDWKRFRVQLPSELPTDSHVVISVHSGHHENKT